MTEDEIRDAQELVGHVFSDPGLLKLALTHASGVDSRADSNERLEFLGDSVLGLVVCAYLHEEFEDLLEGDMTKIKSSVVSRRCCAEVAEEMGLGDLLRLGKGMRGRAGLPSSVIAAVYESIIGAVFLDAGLDGARTFILRHLAPRIASVSESGHQFNFKSVLQQAVQQSYDHPPQYVVLDEKGPDHAKCFEVCVELGAERFPSCWGPSKKQAEQLAARVALVELGLAEDDEDGELRILSETLED